MNDEISVFGEKEGVIQAVQQIKKEFDEAVSFCLLVFKLVT